MQSGSGELARFRVWPGSKHGLYFTVRVFAYRTQMMRAAVDDECFRPSREDRRTLGCFQSYRLERPGEKRIVVAHDFGTMYLCRKELGSGVIAHECSHAVAAWWSRRHDNLIVLSVAAEANNKVTSLEEEWCYAMGDVMGQVVDGLYETGVYDDTK